MNNTRLLSFSRCVTTRHAKIRHLITRRTTTQHMTIQHMTIQHMIARHTTLGALVFALLLSILPLPAPALHAAEGDNPGDNFVLYLPTIGAADSQATSAALSTDDLRVDELRADELRVDDNFALYLPMIGAADFQTTSAVLSVDELNVGDARSTVVPAANEWEASYWNNESLSGPPLVVRTEPLLEHYWFAGEAPLPGFPSSNWSVRWTRTAMFDAHNYRFFATSDDGMRVYVDGELIVDQWREQSVQTFTADVLLTAGAHEIWVEYYETRGPGVAKLTWEKAEPLPTDSWRGEYFNNIDLDGTPVLVRSDSEIDFDWGHDSPATGVVNRDDFSVRWTRSVYFEEGRYKFETETNDGIRLYVDDMLIIDQWRSMGTKKYSEKVHMTEGNHRIRMEYFDDGTAVARLNWGKTSESVNRHVGNIITCVPKNPPAYAWIRIYRRSGDEWVKVTQKGIGSIHPSGFLKVDGLEVDMGAYGGDGHPYRVEQWIDNQLTQSVGNTDAGEAEFRIYPAQDNYTPWGCP